MSSPDVLSRKYDDLLNTVQNLSHRIRALEEKTLQNAEGWTGQQTNVTTKRDFNANTVVVADLADVVGTLIADLVETRTIA